jgi:hypothetical protein
MFNDENKESEKEKDKLLKDKRNKTIIESKVFLF